MTYYSVSTGKLLPTFRKIELPLYPGLSSTRTADGWTLKMKAFIFPKFRYM